MVAYSGASLAVGICRLLDVTATRLIIPPKAVELTRAPFKRVRSTCQSSHALLEQLIIPRREVTERLPDVGSIFVRQGRIFRNDRLTLPHGQPEEI